MKSMKLNEGAWGAGPTQSDGVWDSISEVYHQTLRLIADRASKYLNKKDGFSLDYSYESIGMIQYYLAIFVDMESQNSKNKDIIALRKIYLKHVENLKENKEKFVSDWSEQVRKSVRWRIDNAEEIFDKLVDPTEKIFQPLNDMVERILGGDKAYTHH